MKLEETSSILWGWDIWEMDPEGKPSVYVTNRPWLGTCPRLSKPNSTPTGPEQNPSSTPVHLHSSKTSARPFEPLWAKLAPASPSPVKG